MKKANKLPSFLQPCLPSYNIDKLDPYRDKNIIITSILNTASRDAMRWLYRTYSKNDIANIIKAPKKGAWHKDILDYWVRIFGIKIGKKTYSDAIIKF